jgi:biotin transport system substrate-specific component
MVTASLLAALISASAYVAFPFAPVPVTLQVFVVTLAALLSSPGWAGAAMGLYVALGAAGLPVFAGARGGIGVLFGPTGGYLFGFVLASVLGALARSALIRARVADLVADIATAGLVILVIYAVGTVQLALVAGLSASQAIIAGVVPFLVPDAAKAFVAVGVARVVRRSARA